LADHLSRAIARALGGGKIGFAEFPEQLLLASGRSPARHTAIAPNRFACRPLDPTVRRRLRPTVKPATPRPHQGPLRRSSPQRSAGYPQSGQAHPPTRPVAAHVVLPRNPTGAVVADPALLPTADSAVVATALAKPAAQNGASAASAPTTQGTRDVDGTVVSPSKSPGAIGANSQRVFITRRLRPCWRGWRHRHPRRLLPAATKCARRHDLLIEPPAFGPGAW
jgi:hypothetical protein